LEPIRTWWEREKNLCPHQESHPSGLACTQLLY